MNIAVVGVGYVGLVTAAVFSHFDNNVWAVDVDRDKILKLKQGKSSFYEQGLANLIKNGLKSKKLHFTTSYSEAIKPAKVIFICVGTPAQINGGYNLDFVFSSSESIARNLSKGAIVVIKSTVPPRTNDEVRKRMQAITKVPFELAFVPEFLSEGSAVEDSFRPSRLVIGVESKEAKEILLYLHQPIQAPRLVCDVKSAQLIKYAANAFLATKISFINSIARICEKVGADIKVVEKGLGLDPRIGDQFLHAGLGYGGSCFPKDTWALINFSQKLGYDLAFLRKVDKVNKDQVDYFVSKVVRLLDGSVKNKKIAVLGLAFKPNTDDLRESRSILVIKKLQHLGAKISAYDPVAVSQARRILKNVQLARNAYQAIRNSSALLITTEWDEFGKLDFKKVKSLMKKPVIVDGRNLLNPKKMKRLGFLYEGIGRR